MRGEVLPVWGLSFSCPVFCASFCLFLGRMLFFCLQKRCFSSLRGCFSGMVWRGSENFFVLQCVHFHLFCVCRGNFFEKIFWRFGKRLYLCIRFRRKNGMKRKPSRRGREEFETDEKIEIACVNHSILTGWGTRRRVKTVSEEREQWELARIAEPKKRVERKFKR